MKCKRMRVKETKEGRETGVEGKTESKRKEENKEWDGVAGRADEEDKKEDKTRGAGLKGGR